MTSPSCIRSPFGVAKRLKISPARTWEQPRRTHSTILDHYKEQGLDIKKLEEEAKKRKIEIPEVAPLDAKSHLPLDKATISSLDELRLPRAVYAAYLRPLRRAPQYGVPVCDLQLRSYSVRNLELFADTAMRAAYYLNLPAKGPVPLPRITERWTVPRANFIFKKSQENFERRTVRRLIQIQDGEPEVVRAWLGFLEKHQYHGVGMKANVWEWEELGCGKKMEEEAKAAAEETNGLWEGFGRRKLGPEEKVRELLNSEPFRRAMHGDAPMILPEKEGRGQEYKTPLHEVGRG